MLVITIQGSFSEAKKTIKQANKKGEIIELRLDLLENLIYIEKLKKLCSLPVIFTLRKRSQGGRFFGSEREREEIILELLALNPAYVDLEYDCDPMFVKKVRQNFPNIKIICSYHDFQKTPEDLEVVLTKMRDMHAAIYKLATSANSSIDSLRMLVFVQKYEDVAGMCMGENGAITRILGPIVNNLLTYAPIDKKTAPGQICVDVLEKIYHFSRINRETIIYALIGDPVDKSIGHLAHNYIYNKLKLNAVYVKFIIKPNELTDFYTIMQRLPFLGFSVTMPLKEKIGSYLDIIDPPAKIMGAINTLVKKKDRWQGFNTDAAGALDAIETTGKIADKQMIILGTGGTAKALAFESIQRGGKVLILNRNKIKAERLAHQLGCEGAAFNDLPIDSFDILINATPIGMSVQSSETLISEEMIPPGCIVFDAIIKPKETNLLNQAKRKGCRVIYGYQMFARQAIKQLEIWFDQPLDQENLLTIIDEIYHKDMSSPSIS